MPSFDEVMICGWGSSSIWNRREGWPAFLRRIAPISFPYSVLMMPNVAVFVGAKRHSQRLLAPLQREAFVDQLADGAAVQLLKRQRLGRLLV